jgi:uncharacterized protein (DUF305 family)
MHAHRRITLPALGLLLAVVVAACGSSASDTTGTEESSPAMDMSSEEMQDMASEPASEAAATGLNEADVTFLQNMVPHHLQAVEMAEMVPNQTSRPELLELSGTIISTQSAEVDQMNGLLEAAGEEPVMEMEGMDHSMGGMDMPGMMDQAAMDELAQLRDQEFDLAFLGAMTEHHAGAIEMAEQVLEEGENPEVTDLARDVIEAQRAEIDQMEGWRQQWSAA